MQIDPQVVTRAARAFGLAPEALEPRNSSDGVLFRAHGPSDHALKLVPADEAGRDRLLARWAFVAYLAENGVPVAQPLPSPEGETVVWLDGPERCWSAVMLPWFEGQPLDPRRLDQTKPAVLRAWGRLLGRMHALSKGYSGGQALHDWREEAEAMLALCEDVEVRAAWERMIAALDDLPRDAEAYGLVHNDLHSFNILVQGEEVRVIDFDVCGRHWFACDLAITQQSELWMPPNTSRLPTMRRLFQCIWEGYRQENPLDPSWRERIGLFLDYRRLLLYSVFHAEYGQAVGWQRACVNRWQEGIQSGRPVTDQPWWL